jgi:hypothetical protein
MDKMHEPFSFPILKSVSSVEISGKIFLADSPCLRDSVVGFPR